MDDLLIDDCAGGCGRPVRSVDGKPRRCVVCAQEARDEFDSTMLVGGVLVALAIAVVLAAVAFWRATS